MGRGARRAGERRPLLVCPLALLPHRCTVSCRRNRQSPCTALVVSSFWLSSTSRPLRASTSLFRKRQNLAVYEWGPMCLLPTEHRPAP